MESKNKIMSFAYSKLQLKDLAHILITFKIFTNRNTITGSFISIVVTTSVKNLHNIFALFLNYDYFIYRIPVLVPTCTLAINSIFRIKDFLQKSS